MAAMRPLHVKTPLVPSPELSARLTRAAQAQLAAQRTTEGGGRSSAKKKAGVRVMLKLDALQPSGSFKIRGIGHMAQAPFRQAAAAAATAAEAEAAGAGGKDGSSSSSSSSSSSTQKLDAANVLLVSSSGGNAGAAVAYAASQLGCQALVVTPESTPVSMRERIVALGEGFARVEVHGAAWDHADAKAREIAAGGEGGGEEGGGTGEGAAADGGAQSGPVHRIYVPPFDDPALWEGHASIVDELVEDLPAGTVPDVVVTVCGGGGLVLGLLQGCDRQAGTAWDRTELVVAETEGANCLAASLAAGRTTTIDAIRSVAKSLGALKPAEALVERALREPHRVRSAIVTDAHAVAACARFADDHRVLVEPACGAGLALVYEEHAVLVDRLAELLAARGGDGDDADDVLVVVEVCGGSMTSLAQLADWVAAAPAALTSP